MIDKFEKILEQMDAKGGVPVALFALLKMDDLTDRWTVIYADESAELTEERKKEIFDKLSAIILQVLAPEELPLIARIGVFSTENHLIKSLLRFQSGAKIKNEQANGSFIHEGYIVKAAMSNTQGEKTEEATTSKGEVTSPKKNNNP